MVNEAISKLAAYAIQKDFIEPEDRTWAINTILDVLKLMLAAFWRKTPWFTGTFWTQSLWAA